MALAHEGTNDPWNDLESFLTDDIPIEDLDPNIEMPPSSMTADLANRLCRKARSIERRMEEAEEVARAEITRIQTWLGSRGVTAANDLAWIDRSLEAYARSTGRSTVKLPNGTLSLRKASVRTLVTDEDAAISWLEEHHPDGVNIKKSVARTAVKSAFTPTSWERGISGNSEVMLASLVDGDGEIVPGVNLERAVEDTTFSRTVSDV